MSVFISEKDTAKLYVQFFRPIYPKSKQQCKNELIYIRDFEAVQKNSQSCIIRFNRVWKGIFWIREDAKYFNWKRDLTATRKRHSQIFRHRMPDFFTSVCRYSQPSKDTRNGVPIVKITKYETKRKKQILGFDAIGKLCRHGTIIYYCSQWN